ncbi:hypothetical protein SRABI27_00001 [Pedobacter sp. Bi27]|uniref:hypothetical protein n=1 Tax=Pedobacter sp. Bi27 TaxID=2822351 RepID=UPI001D98AA06|nr:hypothetical protein [Pedobacter sp. Bi27]CAH0129596.1 hypothetical protein SRABI27_00001 [Pedobacter sp. Bi27]
MRIENKILKTAVLLLLIGLHKVNAQTPVEGGVSTFLPKVIPPSPTAASLGKYGDIPVGEYTGTASINIPVHVVSIGKYSLPITLNYSSSGLKVEEKSSWVGLGWSLSAGGVITRSVHGKADEKPMGYWALGNKTDAQLFNVEEGQPLPGSSVSSPVWNGGYDLEPDIFYYNFAGKSGKFVMDAGAGHNAHCINYKNLKIEHNNSLSSFTITDDDGSIYLFDALESSTSDGNTFTSAWYLSKITTSAGEIVFTYSSVNEFSSGVQKSEVDYTNLSPAYQANKEASSSASSIEIEGKVLQQIDAFGQKVKFYTSKNRLDIPLSSVLDYITVEDYNGVITKKFTFGHSYFGDVNSMRSNKSDDVRLKLDNFNEISTVDGAVLKSHLFEYYSPEAVPAIDSKSQDYWGYYNGVQNSTLLVKVDPLDYAPADKIIPGGNRDSNPSRAMTGVLKSITYPTGGSSTFVYEGNDCGFADVGGENKIPHGVSAIAVKSSAVNIPIAKATFSLITNQKLYFNVNGKYTGPAPVENGPSVFINLINSDGSKTVKLSRYMVNNNTTEYINLDAGDYELISSVDGTGQTMSAQMNYITYGEPFKKIPIGGLRIKQIINLDPVTGLKSSENFSYVMKDDPDRSSGVVMSNLRFVDFDHGYIVRTSYSSNYLGTTQGSNVGYKMVTSYTTSVDVSALSFGKKESYYTTAPVNLFGQTYGLVNGYLTNTNVPSTTLVTDFDVYRGFLTKELIYNSQNVAVKETSHNYNFDESLSSSSPNYFDLPVKKGYNFTICTGGCPSGPANLSNLLKAKIICRWIYKTSTIEKSFDVNGLNPVENSTSYYYENPVHAQTTKIETRDSKGHLITTVNKYPQDDFTDLTSIAETARQSLISKHIINPILQQSIFRDGTLIEKTLNNYKNWSASIVEPETIYKQNGAYTLDARIQFYNYDYLGNLLEWSMSNGPKEIYLWGYNKQYPVAKITNTDYATVSSLINQALLDNPNDDNTLRTYLNTLRAALPNSFINTYTYKPLVGMTSQTDAKGMTTYYEYDAFQRLKAVKDQNGNILKQTDYHYKN